MSNVLFGHVFVNVPVPLVRLIVDNDVQHRNLEMQEILIRPAEILLKMEEKIDKINEK